MGTFCGWKWAGYRERYALLSCRVLECWASYTEQKASNLLGAFAFTNGGHLSQIFTPTSPYSNSADFQSCHLAPCHRVLYYALIASGSIHNDQWCCGAVLGGLIVDQLTYKLPTFCGTYSFHCHVQKCQSLDLIVSQLDPVCTFIPLFEIHFHTFLPCVHEFTKCCLPFRF